MPPMAPTVPVFSTQWSHPYAKTGTQPLVTRACTSTNMAKANGTSGSGRSMRTVVAFGKVSRSQAQLSLIKETRVAWSDEFTWQVLVDEFRGSFALRVFLGSSYKCCTGGGFSLSACC